MKPLDMTKSEAQVLLLKLCTALVELQRRRDEKPEVFFAEPVNHVTSLFVQLIGLTSMVEVGPFTQRKSARVSAFEEAVQQEYHGGKNGTS